MHSSREIHVVKRLTSAVGVVAATIATIASVAILVFLGSDDGETESQSPSDATHPTSTSSPV